VELGWAFAAQALASLASPLLAWIRPGHPSSELSDACRLAGLLAWTLSGYALTLPHTPPRYRPGSWLAPVAALRLLRDRSFAVYCAGSLGVSLTFAFGSQNTPLLLEALGIPRPWLAPTLTLSQSMEVFSLALLPLLFLHLRLRSIMLLGLGLWTLGLTVLAVGKPLGLVVFALGSWGICVSCYLIAGQVFVNSRARGDIRASAQGLLSFVNGLGSLAGHLLVGWVRRTTQGDFVATFAVAAGLALVFTLLFFVGFTGKEPTSGEGAEC
jgi:hypothetical protein